VANAEPAGVSEELALVIEERVAVIAGPPAKCERLAAVIEERAAAIA
jgi:malonyl CoA-acyl carrier protein transacylase